MQSSRTKEKQNPLLDINDSVAIDFFRYTKIERDNLDEFKKAEKEFFPHNSSSHQCPKMDSNGIYHQQYRFSFTIKDQRFYLEIGYSTGTNKPTEESFSQSYNSAVPQITIDGIHFVDFLRQHQHKSANMKILTTIDNFICAYQLALAELNNNKGILSRFFASPQPDRSVNYVDKVEVDQKLEQKREEQNQCFIGIDKYRISQQDPTPKVSGLVGIGNFEDTSKPTIISFNCFVLKKEALKSDLLDNLNFYDQPCFDDNDPPAISRFKLENGENLFLVDVRFRGSSAKHVTLDLGDHRSISAFAINNHDLYDLLQEQSHKTKEMYVFLDNYSPHAFEKEQSLLSKVFHR